MSKQLNNFAVDFRKDVKPTLKSKNRMNIMKVFGINIRDILIKY